MEEQTMSDRTLGVGDGLILGVPEAEVNAAGQKIKSVNLYFFWVGSRNRYFRKYTNLSSITSGSTAPSGTGTYDYLGDSGVGSGTDVFQMYSYDWRVLHFGFAARSPDLQIWKAVSPKGNGEPSEDRKGNDEDIVPGTDNRGWYSRRQVSNLYDPPASTERVAFRNDKQGQFLQWAFYNDGPNTLSGSELDLFFTGAGYWLQPVTQQEVADEMLESALSSSGESDIRTIYHQVGGLQDYNLGTQTPKSWEEVQKSTPAFTREFDASQYAKQVLGAGNQSQNPHQ